MDNTQPSFPDHALKYLKNELGPPELSKSAGRVSWNLPDSGPNARVIRVELEPDAAEGGIRLTVANPLAQPPRRVEMVTARTPAQLEIALAIVLDHLAGA